MHLAFTTEHHALWRSIIAGTLLALVRVDDEHDFNNAACELAFGLQPSAMRSGKARGCENRRLYRRFVSGRKLSGRFCRVSAGVL